MPIFEYDLVRLRYEEVGKGFPLLVIPGGGLNATISGLNSHVFNPIEEFSGVYRCITMDLRNANGGRSEGPIEVDRPWESYAEDQITLMDHLGIQKFLVMGFCIGGPFIWNLLRCIPDRIVAAVIVHPSGFRPDQPDIFYQYNIKDWGLNLCEHRRDVTVEMVEKFLTEMYCEEPDFVFTVTREFVRSCTTPVLILPDDIPAHPYSVAMESALLAPNSQVSIYPWKEDDQKIRIAIRHIDMFLRANCPGL